MTFREKFAESTTEEERVEIAKQVAKLRLDADATRAMSWKNIREEVLLTSDEFHKIIRISDYYKEVMLHRLGSLIDEGWVYNGSLNILCGFDVPEEFIDSMFLKNSLKRWNQIKPRLRSQKLRVIAVILRSRQNPRGNGGDPEQ